MDTRYLLAAVAAPALMLGTPAWAHQGSSDFTPTFSVDYENEVAAELSSDSDYGIDLFLEGTIGLHGNVYADSAASAA